MSHKFFYRRNLTFAGLAVLLGLLAGANSFGLLMDGYPPSEALPVGAVVLLVVAFDVCIHATINLVRDVERGYSPERCSLAAAMLFLAFAGTVLLGVALLRAFQRWVS